MSRRLLLALVAPLMACPSEGFPPIVTGRDVPSSSSAPEIDKVIDIGSPDLAKVKQIPTGNGDGAVHEPNDTAVRGKGRQP